MSNGKGHKTDEGFREQHIQTIVNTTQAELNRAGSASSSDEHIGGMLRASEIAEEYGLTIEVTKGDSSEEDE